MELVRSIFNDRVSDIESYFELVHNIELAISTGNAVLRFNDNNYMIQPEQQKILYSSIYLHLYNLIESTISSLIKAIERHATLGIDGQLNLLTEKMRKLYVTSVTAPYELLNNEKRLEKAILLFEQVLNLKPFDIKIPLGGGGNWDVSEISKLSNNIGVEIRLSGSLRQKVMQPFRDDKAPIRLIKEIRNKLAHGSISFTECGNNHVASDFRRLIDIVKDYLGYIIDQYDAYINYQGYRSPTQTT
ncbi:MAE_28990/MAE_18760 family HEPN-like nuclease [Acinetobacter larvae]|uniref:MAE-28990/MAE-18760-like HEPN domain-containing protein n=1 Tax=Acinetobacter larvae TaxID=1789224 RepID=A0A1B2LZ29_9GAMM|nr:MAE_28990/MAE_18760 family HEPN-like nuclease [Acinetobacter larvae]AOA58186.1 hypothetical protein BFG52_07360 [Acinetobacter larvae]